MVSETRDLAGPEQAAQDAVAICKGIMNAAALTGETDVANIRARLTRAATDYLDHP